MMKMIVMMMIMITVTMQIRIAVRIKDNGVDSTVNDDCDDDDGDNPCCVLDSNCPPSPVCSGHPDEPAGVHVHSPEGDTEYTQVTLWWQPGKTHGEQITFYRIDVSNNFNHTWTVLVPCEGYVVVGVVGGDVVR